MGEAGRLLLGGLVGVTLTIAVCRHRHCTQGSLATLWDSTHVGETMGYAGVLRLWGLLWLCLPWEGVAVDITSNPQVPCQGLSKPGIHRHVPAGLMSSTSPLPVLPAHVLPTHMHLSAACSAEGPFLSHQDPVYLTISLDGQNPPEGWAAPAEREPSADPCRTW